MKIALLPGGFKPPHLGHYNMAKYLADFADDVIVRIGRKERDGIGPELALEIFNYYKAADPDPRAQKLTISVASHPSPVKDVYDFVEQIAPEGSELVLGMGEKDAQDGRYNRIPAFAEPRNIKAEIKLVPPQAGGISGTRMREIIKSNNKKEFFKYIPEFLPEEIKEEIWTKLQDTTMPSDVSEGITNYIPAIDKIKNLAKTLYSTKHLPQGNPENRTPEEEKEYRDILDNKRDAFRHILASAYFTTKIGGFLTKGTGEALELIGALKSKLKGGPFDSGWDMDSANNQLGVELGKKNPDASFNDFVSLVQNIIDKGEFYTSDGNTLHKNLSEFMGGTMNREEMAKHNANMKKLRKFFSKQGDQMTQIPTKLTKGLVRKLYEGRYDEEVLKQSRFVINKFKEEFGKKFTGESDKSYIGWLKGTPTQRKNSDEYQLNYKLDLEFIPDSDLELMPFDIYANAGPNSIYIKIVYNPDSFPEAYNKLIYEVKDAIRHELEHVGQYEFDKDAYPEGEDVEGFEYFTAEEEIPAFVQGLYKQAKTRKLPLSQVFDEFLADRSAELTDKEEELIKLIWTDYARRNLPAAQLDENIDREELKKGIEVEKEHTNDPKIALKIALDHLAEDPKYYTKLATLGLEEGDPKIGTGKKPKGSGRRLYTDEDPTDTVNVKFSSRQDIVDTLNKKSFKSKSHARQSQIINLIHQRVRAAYNRAKDPDVKRRLKTALDYAEKRKEASKKKTQRLKKENFPPYKANQVQQVRYKASDVFTRDIEKAKKLGYDEDMKESKLFSKEWWVDIISETLLNEGGAAGHMAHPFDLPQVNTGKDLIKSF